MVKTTVRAGGSALDDCRPLSLTGVQVFEVRVPSKAKDKKERTLLRWCRGTKATTLLT